MRLSFRPGLSVVVLAAASAMLAAAPAAAHVQVRPSVAAPGDAVLFQVLVPNERDVATTEVSIRVPKDVLPFGYEDPPGWRRRVILADDGSTEEIRWRGRLPKEEFVRFAFLASTPEREGQIAWRAIQTYADGEEVAWVGPPDAEEPAAVTRITREAPRENAGGESGGGSGGEQPAQGGQQPGGGQQQPAQATPQPASSNANEGSTSSEGGGTSRDPLAIALGGAGLLLGALALIIAVRRRGEEEPEAA